MVDTITISGLERILRDYDEKEGSYPESKYEGYSIYRFVLARLGIMDNKHDTDSWIDFDAQTEERP